MFTASLLSRDDFESQPALDCDHAIISIKRLKERGAVIPENPQCKGVLGLEFDDVERDENGRCISDAQAKDVMDFVTRVYPQIEVLVFQCHDGRSQGPGIAAALAKAQDCDCSFYFNHEFIRPNMYVYKKVLKAAHENLKKHVDDLMLRVRELDSGGSTDEANTLLNKALTLATQCRTRFSELEE